VLDGDTLVGVVSDRDLRNLELPALVELENLGQAQELARRPIGDVMSSNVISVSPETEVSEAIDLMIEQKIGAVVVVEADSDKLIGIVSYIDVLRAARDLL
jgi:CBS domain-containing protein